MGFQILEPYVTLTDYGLVVLSVILAFLLYKGKTKNKEGTLFSVFFFLSLACASFFGGTVHGFFPDAHSLWHNVLWNLTVISIGLVALCSWVIAGGIILPKYKKIILNVALVEFIGYCVYVIVINNEFKIAIYNYIPATIFLLLALIIVYAKEKVKYVELGILGIILTFVAAWVQQAQIALHPVYINHNVFYHIIQAIALVLIFFALKSVNIRKQVKR